MKINDTKLKNEVGFRTLPFGGVFKWGDEVRMRIDPINITGNHYENEGVVNSVNMKTGDAMITPWDARVEYLENSVLYLDH